MIAGYLGEAELAANTIMYIVGGLSYMVLISSAQFTIFQICMFYD